MVHSLPEKKLIVDRFVPTIIYVRENGGFHTRVCAYNYFSELFPDVKTGATAHLSFFDSAGQVIGYRSIHLEYRGQLQFDAAELGVPFEGTAGLSLVPDTVPEARHDRLVGTGYYAYYFDDAGHADTSHEWDAMTFKKTQSSPWICLMRPLLFPEAQIIVMSAYYAGDETEGRGEWNAAVRNGQGAILSRRDMPSLPARGCVRTSLRDMFPDIAQLAEREGTVSVEVNGTNIQGPFTWVSVPGGDFNIHHFC